MMPNFIKNQKYLFNLILILFLVNGCTSANPFKEVKLVPLGDVDPIAVKDNFEKKNPSEYQIATSVLFKYYRRSFYSLGYLSVDLKKDFFTLAALDPSGIRLFQLTDDNGEVEYSTSIEKLEKLSPYVRYITDDIRNIYFNNIPSDSSYISKEEDRIIFTDTIKSEKIEYTFGGVNNTLLNKKLLNKRSWFWRLFFSEYYSVWSVDYYGGELKNNKFFPENVFYQNNKLGYELIIRLKEIM